jgi:hypothetical protein|nr:MAG TPA: endonuclease [Crassvirales sp.]
MQRKNIKLEEIVELYNTYNNIGIIAEKLNCCTANISKRLRKAGISINRDYSKRRKSSREKLYVDESYFKSIDTEDKAYFLGLMYADGSVSKNTFYLKLKDEDIIQEFKKYLKAETNIKIINNQYSLTICRQSMCNDLINQGCYINKTASIRFPFLDKKLMRHFIRGFYDGDGSLILNANRSHNCLNFTSGSLEFLQQLQDNLKGVSITNGGISKEKNYEVWHLRYGGKQVHIILDWLYNSSNLYLKRKYNKYLLSK